MRKEIKGGIIGFAICGIVFFSFPSFASNTTKSILAAINYITININGDKKTCGNILYNGNVYVKVDDLSKHINYTFKYDKNKNVLNINTKDKQENGNTKNEETVIESKIESDFEGLDYGNIYKLSNGQIWEQTSSTYEYEYEYRPDVIIYKSGSVYKMKVENVEKIATVKRIK